MLRALVATGATVATVWIASSHVDHLDAVEATAAWLLSLGLVCLTVRCRDEPAPTHQHPLAPSQTQNTRAALTSVSESTPLISSHSGGSTASPTTSVLRTRSNTLALFAAITLLACLVLELGNFYLAQWGLFPLVASSLASWALSSCFRNAASFSSALVALAVLNAQYMCADIFIHLPRTNPNQRVVGLLVTLLFVDSTILASFPGNSILLFKKLHSRLSSATQNPFDDAPWWSFYTFWWIRPTLDSANAKNSLEMDDLPPLSSADAPALLQHRFWTWWNKHGQTASPFGLLWATAFLIQPGVFLNSYLHGILFLVCMFADPILLKALLSGGEQGEDQQGLWVSILLVAALAVSMLVRVSCMEVCYFNSTRVSNNVRSALVQAIFKTTINGPSDVVASGGKLINLMATDADKLGQTSWGIFFLAQWTFAVSSLPFVLYFMLDLVGYGALLAVVVLLVSTVFSRFIGNLLSASQKRLQEAKDARSKLLRQVIRSIKVTKLEGLEPHWSAKLSAARTAELEQLRAVQYLSAFNNFVGALFGLSVPLNMFLWVTLVEGRELDAATAFTVLAWIAQMQWSVSSIPQIFNLWSSVGPSLERILQYMKTATREASLFPHITAKPCTDPSHSSGEIHLHAASPLGEPSVNLSLRAGELAVVIGTTGSGKSRLLGALSNPSRRGSTASLHGGCAHGSVALVLQQPFLLNASVRDNILFGLPLEEVRMQEALARTELVPDMAALPRGVLTMVGPSGVQLSGGQKARVCLARALYADADCYLLDDILSAVDRTTGMRIWNNVICYLKARAKSVVLVTHQIQFLSRSEIDTVVLMDNCEIRAKGPFAELSQDSHVARCLELLKTEDSPPGSPVDAELSPKSVSAKTSLQSLKAAGVREDPSISLAELRDFLGPLLTSLYGKTVTSQLVRDHVMIHFQNPTDELSGTEVSQSGAVSFSDFKYYLRHFGSIGYLVLIAFVWICVNMSSSLWISIWTDQSGKEDAFAQWVYLAVFGGLGCLEALVVCCQAIILFLSAVRASTTVHEEMVQKLLSVPLSYFDSHSSGFVLNRFLQDLGSIDSSVPHTLMETISRTFSIAAQFMFIVFITPFVLVIAPFVIVFYIFVATTFRTAARDTRRLESASRSPVYDLFGDVLNGLESVQCFGAQGRFESWNLRLVERMSSCKVGNEAVNKWAQALIVQSSCVFYFFSGFIGVSLLYQGVISVSSFGLVLMYAANLQRALMDYVMGLTNLETNFVAVERVVEFVKERSGKEDSGSFGPAQWPADGCLDVEQLRLRYTINREEVLKGVSFSVKPGENIAVIGRTGCGKSSLMAALSQQYPPSNGDILIDGVDVSTVSPKKMRDIIRIIPQETMLFDGTIRDNVLLGREDIDDAKIWDTLALVQLKERIAKMSGGLDAEIQFGGSDFSAGERQLLCLARALSSGVTPKVLICDEVTANVDLETDFMVLDVLMKFPSSVIMVMHRLEHLDKFDKVLMLNKGRVIEYAHASELMQDSEEFRNFVQHNAE